MTAATLPRSTRTARALGIIERHECVPQEDGRWLVRDTATGSGRWHLATPTSCDCYDASKGHQCKHQRACAAEALALASYADEWDALTQPQTFQVGQLVNLRTHPTGQPAQVIEVYRLNDGTERVRSTTIHTHATNVHNAADLMLHVPRCPMCGCPLEGRQFYTGGHGWAFYEVCSGDATHSNRRPRLEDLPEC